MNGIDIEGVSENEITSYMNLFKSFSTEDLSYILSSLRRMDVGDVEANLIAFIFCTNEYREMQCKESQIDVNSVASTGPDEGSFRNQVLLKREKNKISAGVKSLEETTREVSMSDARNLFQFEKVSD